MLLAVADPLRVVKSLASAILGLYNMRAKELPHEPDIDRRFSLRGFLSDRSPVRRLRALTASRQKWQDRVAAKHREIRFLRVKVHDLQVSRDLWKQRALATEDSNVEALSPGEAGPSQP
jgi:hypothetical protein